jgi:uncharacterized protein YabN with tetrapyrrole methylase and pyrophosphatase domain
MAKSRKPAIGGLARPEGFLDDVVYPIAQKAARKVQKMTLNAPEPSRRESAYWASAKLESKLAQKRMSSYSRKTNKFNAKLGKALEQNKFGKATRNARKVNVNWEKADEMHSSGRNVRKAAQRARKEMKKR